MLEILLRDLEPCGLVVPPLVVVVHGSQAGVAEGGALQKSPAAVLAVAIQALQGCQLSAYYALPGRVFHDVGDVQDFRGQDSIINLELPSEPRHLKHEDRGRPLELDARVEEGLLKELLHCWHFDPGVLCDKQLIEVGRLAGGELQEWIGPQRLGQ